MPDKKTGLPRYEDDFPGWIDMRQIDIKRVTVYVDDIIGGSKTRANEYNGDWSPVDGVFDLRYDKAFNFVKKQMESRGKECLDLGWIHLFEFTRDDGALVYYVCSDGHRRTSACKQLGAISIIADVTKLW